MLAIALGAAMFFAQQIPGGNPIVTPPEVRVTNTTVVNVPPFDPQAVSDASVIADHAFIVNVAQPIPVEWTNALCSLPDVWRTTPANLTYEQPAVRDLAVKIGAAALGLLGLAILAQGLGHALIGTGSLGRVAMAVVMSIGNLAWWQIGIGLNNALAASIGAPDLCASLIKPHIEIQTPDPGAALGAPVLVIVYAVVSLLLLVSLLFRLGLLDVLIAAGSLALMCYASDQTEHIAHWYQRLALGTLFGQVLLVIGLQVAQALSGLGSGIAGTLLGIVVLLICRSLLSALASAHQQRQGAGMGLWLALLARRLAGRVI
jgi:hypothetical protein